MALIATHLQRANNLRERFGLTQNETWARIMANITLPISESANIILEYSTMNDSIEVKQADVSLIDDLLHYDNNYTLSDLEYYANLQAPGGPGMTYSAYSIVSSLASESGRASYTFDRHGSKPYLRGPWFQYSEQILDDYSVNGGTHPAFPFLTGMGAANPIAVMGYLGFHFDLDSFSINPQLPPQISHLQYRTIYWQGHAINVTSNQKHTTLSRIRRSLPNANATYHSTPINVTVSTANRTLSLDFDTALVVDKKRYAYNLAIPDNMAQCSHVYSEQDYEPGQVPLAAVDGAISTYWQPKLSNTTASITVDLRAKPFQLVTGFYFDWAQNPPTSYAVHFSNASSIDAVNLATAGNRTASVSSSKHIKISHAYNATEVGMLLPYSSNHTNVTLEKPVWSGRYATLSILGNQGDKPHKGATVAEWAIIGSNGSDMVRKADTSRRRLGN